MAGRTQERLLRTSQKWLRWHRLFHHRRRSERSGIQTEILRKSSQVVLGFLQSSLGFMHEGGLSSRVPDRYSEGDLKRP